MEEQRWDRREPEQRLAEIAARLNIPAESLAEAAVRELVDQSEGEVDHVAKRPLEKNRAPGNFQFDRSNLSLRGA